MIWVAVKKIICHGKVDKSKSTKHRLHFAFWDLKIKFNIPFAVWDFHLRPDVVFVKIGGKSRQLLNG
jgi:hypothetical protein